MPRGRSCSLSLDLLRRISLRVLWRSSSLCCSHAAKPMSEEKVNKLIDLCLHLEDVADMNEIIDLVR